MIVVTVGMHIQPFDRLLQAMEAYAATTNEDVLMQVGVSQIRPRRSQFIRFTSGPEMLDLYRRARVVVSHGGSTVLEARSAGSDVFAVPRQRRFREHIDDHQVDFIAALAQRDIVFPAFEVGVLPQLLSGPLPALAPYEPDQRLATFLTGYFDRLVTAANPRNAPCRSH